MVQDTSAIKIGEQAAQVVGIALDYSIPTLHNNDQGMEKWLILY